MTTIGWYVHHHGAGHLTRFLAVREHLDADVVVASSLPAPRTLPPRTTWVQLARDDEPVPQADGSVRRPEHASPTVHGLLHWAPLDHPGHRSRLTAIAALVTEHDVAAFVVDVSVEVTLLVRLLGVPTVVMTQPGDRSDLPHRLAYDAADRVIAPWRAGLHVSDALARVDDRVRYVGGISRFDGRAVADTADDRGPAGRIVVLGSVGAPPPTGHVRAGAVSTGWTVLGSSAETWHDDPWEILRHADVVVSAAGQNSVADLAAIGARAVVVPQPRPFGEQVATGRALRQHDLAVVVDAWPAEDAWPALLDRARALEPAWERWGTRGAARRAADAVMEVVS
ncbi:glycosyltransferase [Curtobacterium sp. RRHDQ10]|uniref:glycosyltransferase n=1 Tax=Curtobacterium phyllosphaerae TaxID=3413379 RepID=UPI003BF22DA9